MNKYIKTLVSVALVLVAFFLIREGDEQTSTSTQFLYLLGTIAYVGLLIILGSKTNFFGKQ